MIAGICMVRDEADIIEHTVRHMLTQVDIVFVSDNGSVDDTPKILSDLQKEAGYFKGTGSVGHRLRISRDEDPAYYQSVKMTRLAKWAGEAGAEWVVPFDADEWWYSPFGRIGDLLEQLESSIATAALYDHVATAEDRVSGNPCVDIAWRRREAGPMQKVACRTRPYVTIEQGNHGANYGGAEHGQLVVRHFPYRSVEQFVSKVRNGAAAYAATDLPYDAGQHWRDYGALLEANGEEAIREVFETWFWSAEPQKDTSLILDPAP